MTICAEAFCTIGGSLLRSEKSPFTLSWSHYILLLTIKNPDERAFYEIEATQGGWSLPELQRQTASALYERLALSRDKQKVRELAKEGQLVVKPEDVLKEPYVQGTPAPEAPRLDYIKKGDA